MVHEGRCKFLTNICITTQVLPWFLCGSSSLDIILQRHLPSYTWFCNVAAVVFCSIFHWGVQRGVHWGRTIAFALLYRQLSLSPMKCRCWISSTNPEDHFAIELTDGWKDSGSLVLVIEPNNQVMYVALCFKSQVLTIATFSVMMNYAPSSYRKKSESVHWAFSFT